MGTKPKHRCHICQQWPDVRYKPAVRKWGQRRYSWFCFKCEVPFLNTYTPKYITSKQKRRWMKAKYGYQIQTKEEVMCHVQTLEDGLDGQEEVQRTRLV